MPPEDVGAIYVQARELFRERRFAEALNLLDGVPAEYARVEAVLLARASCLDALGRPGEAQALRNAVSRQPASGPASPTQSRSPWAKGPRIVAALTVLAIIFFSAAWYGKTKATGLGGQPSAQTQAIPSTATPEPAASTESGARGSRASAPAVSMADYPAFAEDLKTSSTEVNQLHFSELFYALDSDTARAYFDEYFESNYLTVALRINVGYPVFYWGENHLALQTGLHGALDASLSAIFSRYPGAEALEAAFEKDAGLYDHVFQSLCMMRSFVLETKVLDRRDLESRYRDALDRLAESQLLLGGYVQRDLERFAYTNAVLMQFMLTLFNAANTVDSIDTFVEAANLDPARRRLVEEKRVLVLDNCGFDGEQLRVIDEFVDAVPESARFPIAVQCVDLTYGKKNSKTTVHSFAGGLNVFATRVGAARENPFPDDWDTSVEIDGFSVVLAHEYAHGLDARLPERSPKLADFRGELLRVALADRGNYLRSMLEDGFFKSNPQEFVASIANQYCANSAETLKYALHKYETGNANQINQFVLMASIFAHEDRVTFLEIDRDGVVSSEQHPVTQSDGLITSLSYDGTTYVFTYANGRIHKVTQKEI